VRSEAAANAIVQRAEDANCTIELPFNDHHYAASLIPDEEEMLQTHVRYARIADPNEFRIEVRDGSYTSERYKNYAAPDKARAYHAGDRFVLFVEDLNDSIAFYTEVLGLPLLRRRADVASNPPEAVMLAYVVGELCV
jgi:hypothetical protein